MTRADVRAPVQRVIITLIASQRACRLERLRGGGAALAALRNLLC